jgi:hypothetical protein
MTLEHLSETQLAGYSQRSLDPQELLAVDRHLASCDLCHERLTRISPRASISFESDEEPFHLDYEQHLEPYVDGKASDIDREIVDSHVALCSKCATDLNELLEFKQQPVAVIPRATWRQWLPSPAWAAAIVLAILIPAVAVLMWTRNRTAEQARIVSTEPEKQKELPSPAPSELPREEPLLVLNDAGGQVIVNQRGSVEGLQQLPVDLKESVERALATRRLGASPALKGWLTGAGNLRGGEGMKDTFAPLSPIDVVIETDRPTFRWRSLEGAQHCMVTIFDSKLRQVASSGPVIRSEWTMPNALQRGVTYSWQITAVKDGEMIVSPKPPLPEARFRVLDQRAVDALAKVKETSSHLALGVFYWKHGLIEQSEREFQALATANPDSSVVKELLANIHSLRRR